MTENRVSSLRQLPQEIPPSRDLWQSIAQEIERSPVRAPRSVVREAWLSGLAMAATVAAVAVGVWLGHTRLTGGSSAPSFALQAPAAQSAAAPVYAAFVTDPRPSRNERLVVKALDEMHPESVEVMEAMLLDGTEDREDIAAYVTAVFGADRADR